MPISLSISRSDLRLLSCSTGWFVFSRQKYFRSQTDLHFVLITIRAPPKMHLNLISLFGLFVMILLAWLVSSHRWKVNWRLVTIGVLCQAILAATLFKSQDWTFAQQFSNTLSLLAAFENKTLSAEQIDASLAKRNPSKFSIKTIQTSLENDATKLAHWDARLFPPTSTGAPTLLEIPRYELSLIHI